MYFAALACGLQNGMCTMHLGSIVRTTHVTGLSTDLGTNLGRLIRIITRTFHHRHDDTIAADNAELRVVTGKLQVFLLLGSSFIVGSFSGSWLQHWFKVHA